MKTIPLLGRLAKIQRPDVLPYLPKLILFLQSHHVKTVSFEASRSINEHLLQEYIKTLSKFFTIQKSPFLQTKSIIVDLKKPELSIFQSFSEAKRRAVRRAQKYCVDIEVSHSIENLIKIKNQSAGLFGGITTYGISALWDLFQPEHAAILLAYEKQTPLGGILLLFHEDTAYYWIAGATKHGKKLFAPTLLVWEALKLSKKNGMDYFDFVGVFDERTPKQFSSWTGFTKFKEGFGGIEIYYPRIHS